LNNGNGRLGNAYGFSLETLQKLSDTRTSDNSMTILEVIVEMLKDSDNPDIVDLKKSDVEIVESGSRVSLLTVQTDLGKLTKDFENLKVLVSTVERTGDDDFFNTKLNDFIALVQPDVDKLQKDFNLMVSEFETLVSFYGEDVKDNDPEKFFGIWRTFLNSIVESLDKIQLVRERENKNKKRLEAQQKAVRGSSVSRGGSEGGDPGRGRARGGGPGDPGRGRGRGGQKALVDELFANLKGGGILKGRGGNNPNPNPETNT